MCITCENKGTKDFQNGDSVKQHMIDRGHCFMKIDEGYEEYESFYDFSELFKEKLKQQSRNVPGIEYHTVKVYVDDKEQAEIK